MAGRVAKADTSANELCNKLTNRVSPAGLFSLSDSYILYVVIESLSKIKNQNPPNRNRRNWQWSFRAKRGWDRKWNREPRRCHWRITSISFSLTSKSISPSTSSTKSSLISLSSSSSNFVMMWCFFHFLFVPENLETRLKSLNVLCWILQIINMHGFKKIHKVQKVTMKSHSLISLWITETSYILVLASVWLLRNWMWNQVEIKWYLVAERTKQRIGVLFYVSVYTALNHQWSS